MRIIACEAIEELLSRNHHHFYTAMQMTLLQTVLAQLSTPQPPIFKQALETFMHRRVRDFPLPSTHNPA